MRSLITFTGHGLGLLVNNQLGYRQEAYEADVSGQNPNEPESRHRRARNLLRFLIQGTPVELDQDYQEGLDLTEKALVTEKDPYTLEALRKELQQVFENAYSNILEAKSKKTFTEADERLFIILLSNLIAMHSFCDPMHLDADGLPTSLDFIKIPQKIDGDWTLVTYKVQRLDISPQRGLLSYHKQTDIIYAYGFQPQDCTTANTLLSFRATPPPTLNGAQFANLFNLKPMTSLGEGHNMEAVDEFIKNSTSKIDVSGHSLGGTMALMVGMRFPTTIENVHALNPAPLSFMTLARLRAHWEANLKQGNAASLNVYAQEGDPVPFIDNGFPEGTHYYRLVPKEKYCSNFKPFIPKFFQSRFEAHIRFFAGQKEVLIKEQDLEEINRSLTREFMGDLKAMANLIEYPVNYLSIVKNIFVAKINDIVKGQPQPVQFTIKALNFAATAALTANEMALLLVFMPSVAGLSGLKIAVKSQLPHFPGTDHSEVREKFQSAESTEDMYKMKVS